MKRIAILASGAGSNANTIIDYFRYHQDIKVQCIICNNSKAGVIDIAVKNKIPYYVILRTDLYETDTVINLLTELKIDLIVLAGFLWLIPDKIIKRFKAEIINIHPALLPKYGGKGLYGSRVHEAVINAGEKQTGITIHFVNEQYDEGEIIFQEHFPITESDNIHSVQMKIHELEHIWYPKIIEQLLSKKIKFKPCT
ncbi:MAG: phosphoribosylglycinamide formyltransferase [Chitinophagales bacterium]|nr:phosphoribosylglycinamide formyltransferase [Chitinophagales bacterium]